MLFKYTYKNLTPTVKYNNCYTTKYKRYIKYVTANKITCGSKKLKYVYVLQHNNTLKPINPIKYSSYYNISTIFDGKTGSS